MDQSWMVEAVGFCAGTLTTASFVPQVLKTWRSKSTRDISLAMWLMFSIGVGVWIVYGFLTGSLAIILTNVITLVLAGTVLVIKLQNLTSE